MCRKPYRVMISAKYAKPRSFGTSIRFGLLVKRGRGRSSFGMSFRAGDSENNADNILVRLLGIAPADNASMLHFYLASRSKRCWLARRLLLSTSLRTLSSATAGSM